MAWILEALSGIPGEMQALALGVLVAASAFALLGWRRRPTVTPADAFVAARVPEIVTLAAGEAPGGPVAARPSDSTPWGDAIRRLEAKRGSRVVGFIHYRGKQHQGIEEEHLQDFLWTLREVPAGTPVDVVLHTVGGYPSVIQQIARALKAHAGPTTVFVPYYAFGLTALIALAADRVVMGTQAGFSFPQPTDDSLKTLVGSKGARHVSDETLIFLHNARNAWRELRAFVKEVARPAAAPFTRHLFDPSRMDTTPIGPAQAGKLGLAVSTDMPAEVLEIIEACECYPSPDVELKTASTVTAIGTGATSLAGAGNGGSDGYGWCEPSCHLGVAPLLRGMQERRGTSVICVVHSPNMGSERVDMSTAKDVLRALSAVDPGAPLDVILHTPGGVSFHGWQIARALKAHKGRKTVFVPYFAWSAGTIIALAADEIVMSPHAALGPIDTQYGHVPVSAWVSVTKQKPRKKIEDRTLFMAERSARQMRDDHARALELMKGVYAPRVAERIVRTLNEGTLTHGYPVTFAEARALGLKVTSAMPAEPEQIVRAFRDPDMGYRSVIFCAG